MQSRSRFTVNPTVDEGGTIVIRATTRLSEVSVFIPGHGTRRVPLVNGRGETQIPPDVRGGTQILITDGLVPTPCSTTVDVVGGANR